MAFTRYGEGATSDIFVWDLDRNTLGRRTFDGTASKPIWTPDGTQLIYSDSTEGLRIIASNGTDQPSTIFSSSNATPTSISPDGKLIFDMGNPRKLYMLDLFSQENSEQKATELSIAPNLIQFHQSTISPDGNWIAYVSPETGITQIYVRPFPNINAGKWQASVDGGFQPLWSGSSNELFYFSNNGSSQMKVDFSIDQDDQPSRPIYRFFFFINQIYSDHFYKNLVYFGKGFSPTTMSR